MIWLAVPLPTLCSIISACKDADNLINDRIKSTAVDYRHIVSAEQVDESEIPELI